MSQSELLIFTIEALIKSTHDYMLTGSLVSSMQGEPRATHDIDLVVTVTPESVKQLLQEFSAECYYFDIPAAQAAVEQGGMFNILSNTGDKVDIWTLTDSEFDQMRFSRRQSIEFLGRSIKVSSPEDTILMKLLWSKQNGGSAKQLYDASRVYDLQQDSLDLDYLETWMDKLDLQSEFVALQRYL